MPDDIEEFLRRAAQRRAGRSVPASASPPPNAAPPPAPRPVQRPSTFPPTPAQVNRPPLDADIVLEDVATHVTSHLNTKNFEQRANQMAEEVALADDKVEAHLHDVFDHNLGDLAVNSGAAGSGTSAAIQWTQLLASRDAIRQAFIFSEIIHRPEERW